MAGAGTSNRGRHCMIVHAHYPTGETRVQRQALALIEAGFDVDVLCLRGAGEPRREFVDGVSVRRLPVDRHRGSGMLAQLVEYLAFFVLALGTFGYRHLLHRYSTVQVHNLPDFLVFSALPAKLSRTPIILDLHDLMPEFMAFRIDSDLGHPLVRLVALQERLACRFADRVVTVTDEWADKLRARSARPDDVDVVMNIADTRIFDRAAIGETREPVREEFEVIYHGTFTHRYGVDTLIEAVSRLAGSIPGIRLTLLGDGETRTELIALAERLGLQDRVHFSDGLVGAEDLPAKLCAADVGVVPNRANIFTDGILPTKLLEYVALGIPTVVAETAGVKRYFGPDAVEFFTPGDVDGLANGIAALFRDPERRARMTRNADRFNHEYSWSREAANYVDLVAGLARPDVGRA